METKANVNNESVKQVINKINAEALSLGAIIRNFVSVCEEDAYAKYMLQSILSYHLPDVLVVHSVNAIRKAIVAAYPYKGEQGELLHKRDGIFVPVEKYNGAIISRAFYSAIGVTKKVDVKRASEDEVAKAEAKREERKQKAANTRAIDKANRELLEKFWDECMKATEANIWDIVSKYKVATTETEATSK